MEEKTQKYYSWPGLDASYTEYEGANREVAEKGIKNVYPVGFSSREEADAFRKGMWDSYLKENYAYYRTDADAVIYADGSNVKNVVAGYGLIIFFRNGEVFCESSLLTDKENGKLLSERYDINGERKEERVIEYIPLPGAKNGFVESGWNEAGEFEGARRALEICFLEKKLKKVVLVYDSKTIEERYHLGAKAGSGKIENPAYCYGALCDKIKQKCGEDAVRFVDVNSHLTKNPYRITDMEFVHAVYNDLADAMAKAETGIGEVNAQKNINLLHAIPETVGFGIKTGRQKGEASRRKTRERLWAVLKKEWLRAQFSEGEG